MITREMAKKMLEEAKGLGIKYLGDDKVEFYCDRFSPVNLTSLTHICRFLVKEKGEYSRRIMLACIMGAYDLGNKTNDELIETLKEIVEDQKQNFTYIEFNCTQGKGNTLMNKADSLADDNEKESMKKIVNFVFEKKKRDKEKKDND